MLGIIVPIIVSWYVYKTAKENGRNGILWAFINFVAFFGAQLIFGLAVGVALGLGIALQGWDESVFEQVFQQWNILISLVGFAVGAICSWLIVRHVTRVPDEKFYPQPPAPPTF